MVFLSSSREMPSITLNYAKDWLFLYHFQFIFPHYPVTWYYIASVTDGVFEQAMNSKL
jgi:hypothetical protein